MQHSTEAATIPSRLNVRLSPQEREAVAILVASVTTPHRRPPTVSEAVRAALSIAAEAIQVRSDTPTV